MSLEIAQSVHPSHSDRGAWRRPQLTLKLGFQTWPQLYLTLTTSPWKAEAPFLDLALRASEAAVKVTRSHAPGALDELAHVWSLRGDWDQAVRFESLAVSLAEGPMKDAERKSLSRYREALRSGQ